MAPRGTVSDTPRSAALSRRRIHPARNVFATSRASIASIRLNGNMRPMTAPAEWRCPVAGLPPGRTAAFRLTCDRRTVDGFIVNHGGQYRAYINRCPHAGTTLDTWPNEFLSEDGRWLICATHGAVFAPDTGRCVSGPCAGDALTPLPVRVEGSAVVVACPGR